MESTFQKQTSTSLDPHKLLNLVRAFVPGSTERPPDDPTGPLGPFGPIIRKSVSQWLSLVAHSHPSIYDGPHFGGPLFSDRLSQVALNPQPLPPRYLLMQIIAQAVIDRAELLHELATAMTSELERRGIIIVSGYVGGFVRDLRTMEFRLPASDTFTNKPPHRLHRHWKHYFHLDLEWPPHIHIPQTRTPNGPPIPDPVGPFWDTKFSGTDLIVLGASFAEAAQNTADQNVQGVFADAAGQLAEEGLARLG